MENMDKGLTVPKWVLADKLDENIPNDPNNFGPICLPKPKSLGFSKKSSLMVSVVYDLSHRELELFSSLCLISYIIWVIIDQTCPLLNISLASNTYYKLNC